jgi:hypothetical protein
MKELLEINLDIYIPIKFSINQCLFYFSKLRGIIIIRNIICFIQAYMMAQHTFKQTYMVVCIITSNLIYKKKITKSTLLGSTGIWTQSSVLARQELYPPEPSSQPFLLLVIFQVGSPGFIPGLYGLRFIYFCIPRKRWQACTTMPSLLIEMQSH